MFRKILIANRGEIGVRIARTARRLGIATVGIYSDADRHALHVASTDEAFNLGVAQPAGGYLDVEKIIAIAKESGAEAIHPGYGFLSENADFAESVIRAALIFIGPPVEAIRIMGMKGLARKLMANTGVPVLPGYNGEDQDMGRMALEAARIGFPILIKPLAGGGGKGMHRVDDAANFADSVATARREAKSSFGDDRVLLEKFLPMARHIEIQIFADSHGNTVHLFERDCSLQRRHQKVIEEAPAPGMTSEIRAALCEAAINAAKAVGYVGAGTVEFIADVSGGLAANRFYFMEMNTRLQVEHPVTEMVTGLDLVEWQFRVAAGEALPLKQEAITVSGHAVEARLYAEDPARNFLPQTGKLEQLEFPTGPTIRADVGVKAGDTITSHFDPMLAKIIAHGPTRKQAIQNLSAALAATRIDGCQTNLVFLNRLSRNSVFAAGDVDTGFIERDLDALIREDNLPKEVIAAALLHFSGQLGKPDGFSPFDTLRNFRTWPAESRSFAFIADGIAQEADLMLSSGKDFELRHGQSRLPFLLVDFNDEVVRLEFAGRIQRLGYFCGSNFVRIGLGDALHEFTLADAADQKSGEDASGNIVVAPVPGTITAVHVKPGDKVTSGDTIAIIEAMKMEFALKAMRAGRVGLVQAVEGQHISEGAVIATIENDDA